MKLILFKDGVFINANEKEKYQMVLGASKGELRFDEIKSWLQLKTQTQNQ